MAACNRKTFDEEWEAELWIAEHPWPEPAPDIELFECFNCGKIHIRDRGPGNRRKRRRERGKRQ